MFSRHLSAFAFIQGRYRSSVKNQRSFRGLDVLGFGPPQVLTIEEMRGKRKRLRTERRALQTGWAEYYKLCHGKNTSLKSLTSSSPAHPARLFLHLAALCKRFVHHPAFVNYMLLCIITAGLLVGLQTYPEYADNDAVQGLDTLILVSFWLEVCLKIVAEGLGPWWFLIGPEWAWNTFDLLIVIFSLPNIVDGDSGQVKLLRLVRLMRLTKVFRRIESLHMIVSGLVEGLKSVFYLLVLLLLVFYLYACAGIVLFRENASWHWHSIEVSMLTLLGIATFDGWSEYLYVSYYGCDVYPSSVYTTNVTMRDPDNALGGVMWCQHPEAQPVATVFFFYSFIAICSFALLSLFISTIAAGMTDSVMELRQRTAIKSKVALRNSLAKAELDFKSTPVEQRTRKQARMALLMHACFRGLDLSQVKTRFDGDGRDPRVLYRRLAHACGELSTHPLFHAVMTAVILLAGVSVGMSTDDALMTEHGGSLAALDTFILVVFCVEIVVKVCAEGFRPHRYFFEAWNCFDFLIVALSVGLAGSGQGSVVTMLRLLRLMRVLKLLRAIRELQVIVSALAAGVSTVVWILCILCVFFYFFAVVAVTFFGANDPFHFATLHMAALSLFQVTTMDGWYSTMATSMYGCLRQPGNFPSLCSADNNNAQFALAAIFFVVMIIFGGLVLLALFVGVVCMSVEEAQEVERKDAEVMRRAALITDMDHLGAQVLSLYRECFDLLDLQHSKRLAKGELKLGLACAGFENDGFAGLDVVWERIDRDKNNTLDFAEFLETMLDVRKGREDAEAKAKGEGQEGEWEEGQAHGGMDGSSPGGTDGSSPTRRTFLPGFGAQTSSTKYEAKKGDDDASMEAAGLADGPMPQTPHDQQHLHRVPEGEELTTDPDVS